MKLGEEKEKASLLKKSAQFIGCELFNHCFTGWNSFDRLHIWMYKPKKASLKDHRHVRFDQNEDTFSVNLDELEHHFTENGQKHHT